MHESMIILGVALVILGYGYFSRLLNRYNISGPMVFTAVGVFLSPLGLGTTPIHPDTEAIQLLAEVALIVVLFSDAAAINLSHLESKWRYPSRLLFVAMPLSILLSYFTATLFFPEEPSPLYLLLLALILAPTDAALGKAVVSDPQIPETVRNTLNTESGLNDGIVFPMLLTVLALLAGGSTDSSPLAYIARQILLGAIVGGSIGWVGAQLGTTALRQGWIARQYRNLVPLALAFVAYYGAEALGGNGYIAAFFSGLFFGHFAPALRPNVEAFGESEGELLILVSFLIFGLVFVPAAYAYWDLRTSLFALLSLTLLRMLPVILSFGRLPLDLSTRLFIGWFGPRGIASILYMLVAASQLGGVQGHESIFAAATLTVVFSILLHGLSAGPLARRYARSHPASTEAR